MEFKLNEIEESILKHLNIENYTYYDIVSCKDKGKLLKLIEVINNITKEYFILFELDKFLTDEYLLLKSHNNLKIIITNFYLQIFIEN